ncbi:hypothetical protein OI9_04966 [Enterococcus faecium EnGen0001]|nr:hypothetical protein OI9_04966 [Enterococcus faecium EnGen0001]
MEKGIKGIYRLFAVLVIFFMIWAMASTIFSPRIGAIFSLFRDSYSPKVTIVINIPVVLVNFNILKNISKFLQNVVVLDLIEHCKPVICFQIYSLAL